MGGVRRRPDEDAISTVPADLAADLEGHDGVEAEFETGAVFFNAAVFTLILTLFDRYRHMGSALEHTSQIGSPSEHGSDRTRASGISRHRDTRPR